MLVTALDCCGVKELGQVHTLPRTKVSIKTALKRAIGYYRAGVFVFTQADTASPVDVKSYGFRLAKFIETNELGTVKRIPQFINPNTGRTITMFIWKVNADKLRVFLT